MSTSADPERIAAEWQRRLDEILSLPKEQQWQRGVRGKSAFPDVVMPLLKQIQHNLIIKDAKTDLYAKIERPLPPPLDGLMPMLVL